MKRRVFLSAVGALAASACGVDDATGDPAPNETTTTGGGGSSASSVSASTGSGPLMCTQTAASSAGPFYRPNAPFRDDLIDPAISGTPLTVSGRVLGPGCEPLAGALIDVWQANEFGRYDNDGVDDPPGGAYVLRGRLNADDTGSYSFRTIEPGRYLNGAQYRPSHIHVTVSAQGYAPITTQLYFEGDPYNDIDSLIIDSLIMAVTDAGGGELAATFDFVLQPL